MWCRWEGSGPLIRPWFNQLCALSASMPCGAAEQPLSLLPFPFLAFLATPSTTRERGTAPRRCSSFTVRVQGWKHPHFPWFHATPGLGGCSIWSRTAQTSKEATALQCTNGRQVCRFFVECGQALTLVWGSVWLHHHHHRWLCGCAVR